MTDRNSPDGLWLACGDMERVAADFLIEVLSPFAEPMRLCYEAGIQAPTLPGTRHNSEDLRIAALFLKKTLGDLRAVWLLTCMGYTSQAASVAASLYENALAVTSFAGDEAAAKKFSSSRLGDLPWGAKELAQRLGARWSSAAVTEGRSFTGAEREIAWRNVYSQYKWLCKIKHPTLPSALHDAGATAVTTPEFVVMAAPDLRPEDTPVKATVVFIALVRTLEAVRFFGREISPDKSHSTYIEFRHRVENASTLMADAYKNSQIGPLPFDLRDSSLMREILDIRTRASGRSTS